jgi:hypothetical protein
MEKNITVLMYLPLFIILILGLLSACSNSPPPITQPYKPINPPITVTASPEKASDTVDKVELIYFHSPQRCKTCLCFEKRISYVVQTYFQDELKSGKLTWGVYDLGDNNNTAIINKYRAVGSQLFINTIKDGVDNIKDIQEIWSWGCLKNDDSFDSSVKNVIELSLRGES